MTSQIAPPYQHPTPPSSFASFSQPFANNAVNAAAFATPTAPSSASDNANHFLADLPQPLRTSTPNGPNGGPPVAAQTPQTPQTPQTTTSLPTTPSATITTTNTPLPPPLQQLQPPPPPLAPSSREGQPSVTVSPLNAVPSTQASITDTQASGFGTGVVFSVKEEPLKPTQTIVSASSSIGAAPLPQQQIQRSQSLVNKQLSHQQPPQQPQQHFSHYPPHNHHHHHHHQPNHHAGGEFGQIGPEAFTPQHRISASLGPLGRLTPQPGPDSANPVPLPGVPPPNGAINCAPYLNPSLAAASPAAAPNFCVVDSMGMMGAGGTEIMSGSAPGQPIHAPFRPTMSPLLSSGRIEQTQAFTWIRRHLTPSEDSSVPKQEVYDAYKSFCDKRKCNPINPGDFGKIVKCTFPTMKPRRLGARGQSKYCYSGIKLQVEGDTNAAGTPSSNEDEALPLAPGELERAATQVVCEWAQKLMNAPFNSLLELAEFLVGHLYVNSKSAAAFTILAQMQTKGQRRNGEKSEPTPYRETPNFLQADKNTIAPPPAYGWEMNYGSAPMLPLPPQRASTPLFFEGKYIGDLQQQQQQQQQQPQPQPHSIDAKVSGIDANRNCSMNNSNYNNSTANESNVTSPLKSFNSAFESVQSPANPKDAIADISQRKLASPRRSKYKDVKKSEASGKNGQQTEQKDIDTLQMPPPPANFAPRCVSANILQQPTTYRKRPQSEPRKRTRSDETTNAIYSVSTKRTQYNSVQDLTALKAKEEVETAPDIFKLPNPIDQPQPQNPLGEMNIMHLENDALLDFLGDDANSNVQPANEDNQLMQQTFDLTNLPQSIGQAMTPTSAASVQRCSSISPSTIGNRPAHMVRPTVRVAPRTEGSNQPTQNSNSQYTTCSASSNNANNVVSCASQNQSNLNSSLEGHSFDDSFNYVTQQQNQHNQDLYAQSNPNQPANYNRRPDVYGRNLTAPSPIPPHVFNGHRRQASPSPSPASFITGSSSSMSLTSPSPLTVGDKGMSYNPSTGYYEEESNCTGYSDQSNLSQNYSGYGGYGGNTVLHNPDGNHSFTPIQQPGSESNVSMMNNQLEMLGIKSGDTFNLSNNYPTSEPYRESQPVLLKSYLTDQGAGYKPSQPVLQKADSERTVQLVTPQHLPASEFLRSQARMSSRCKTEETPQGVARNESEIISADFFDWNPKGDEAALELGKKSPSQVPTPPCSDPGGIDAELGCLGSNPGADFHSKESPCDHPVLTPDTDTPLTPLGANDCLGVHQLGDALLEELQGFS